MPFYSATGVSEFILFICKIVLQLYHKKGLTMQMKIYNKV